MYSSSPLSRHPALHSVLQSPCHCCGFSGAETWACLCQGGRAPLRLLSHSSSVSSVSHSHSLTFHSFLFTSSSLHLHPLFSFFTFLFSLLCLSSPLLNLSPLNRPPTGSAHLLYLTQLSLRLELLCKCALYIKLSRTELKVRCVVFSGIS